MITLSKIRDLTLQAEPGNGREKHLSAASGLICFHSTLYVIADDELHLGVFPRDGDQPGELIRLFDGVLPVAPAKRKHEKPDLETLVMLPSFPELPHGAMLAIGSGSRPNRRRGVLLALDAKGQVSGSPCVVDCTPFLAPLVNEFAEVNIEGAVVVGSDMYLFQRGNKQAGNAIIRFPVEQVVGALHSERGPPLSPSSIVRVDIGDVGGVPLCFTDAAALPNGDVVFTCVAENTEDAFNDGACVGAAVGLLDNQGRVLVLERLEQPYKVEGVHARTSGDRIELLLVTDADNPAIPAMLFSASFDR